MAKDNERYHKATVFEGKRKTVKSVYADGNIWEVYAVLSVPSGSFGIRLGIDGVFCTKVWQVCIIRTESTLSDEEGRGDMLKQNNKCDKGPDKYKKDEREAGKRKY